LFHISFSFFFGLVFVRCLLARAPLPLVDFCLIFVRGWGGSRQTRQKDRPTKHHAPSQSLPSLCFRLPAASHSAPAAAAAVTAGASAPSPGPVSRHAKCFVFPSLSLSLSLSLLYGNDDGVVMMVMKMHTSDVKSGWKRGGGKGASAHAAACCCGCSLAATTTVPPKRD